VVGAVEGPDSSGWRHPVYRYRIVNNSAEDTTIAALEVCVESLQRQMIEFWENREAQAGPARRTGPRHG
jgi:hypothetical protein